MQEHEPRPLGGNERAFWRLSESSPLNFAVIAHVGPGLDPERVQNALIALQARHPLLRAQIEMRGAAPWFVWPGAPPAIALDVHACDADAWQPAIEAQVRRLIPWQKAPLARALLLEHGDAGATLSIAFHHAIGDGIAAIAALRDVLWEAKTGRPVSPLVYARSLAAESALPPRARGIFAGARRLGIVASAIAGGRHHAETLRCPVARAAAPHERTYFAEHRVFDPAITTALHARARNANTTMHGAVSAAMLFGVARAAGLRDERAIAFGSPINVRDRLVPAMGEQLGLYLAVSNYRGALSPSTRFWQLAFDIRRRIAEDVESGRAIDSLPLIDLFYKSIGGDGVSNEELGRRWAASGGTTGLTNVGRLELDAPPGLTIHRVHPIGFPSGLDVFNAVASAYGGRLIVNFNWPEPCFDRESARALTQDIASILESAIDGDPTPGSRSVRPAREGTA